MQRGVTSLQTIVFSLLWVSFKGFSSGLGESNLGAFSVPAIMVINIWRHRKHNEGMYCGVFARSVDLLQYPIRHIRICTFWVFVVFLFVFFLQPHIKRNYRRVVLLFTLTAYINHIQQRRLNCKAPTRLWPLGHLQQAFCHTGRILTCVRVERCIV